jgi:hypothetical protein
MTDTFQTISADIRALAVGHPHAKIAWPHASIHRLADRVDAMAAPVARRIEDYHEDDGNVLWWVKPGIDACVWETGVGTGEPPYVGTPEDSEWPGYHQWWTPLQPYPTVWAPAPPPPPVWEVELRGLRTIAILHLPSRTARFIEYEPGLPLKHYEDSARYWKRRLTDMAGMPS